MSRFILPFQSVHDINGHPLDGALLFFYETGTSTLKDTFSDEALATPNANPIVANSRGEFDNIFMIGTYRVELQDKNGVTQPNYPADDVPSADTVATAASAAAAAVSETNAAASAAASAADAVTTNANAVTTNANAVTTNANAVTTNADAVTTTQDAIDTAADAVSAEAARDAAIVNSMVYATETIGRAAVANGEYFKVIGAGDIAAFEFIRVSAGVSTFVTSYPSSAALDTLESAIDTLESAIDTAGTWGGGYFVGTDDLLYEALSSVFSATDKGGWWDAAEPDSVFQDELGATPVTASGQSALGLVIRNALGLESKLNAVDEDLTAWSGGNSGITVSLTGPYLLTVTSASTAHNMSEGYSAPTGRHFRIVAKVKAAGWGFVRVAGTSTVYSDFNLNTGAVIADVGTSVGSVVGRDSEGYWELVIDYTSNAGSGPTVIVVGIDSVFTPTSGDDVSGILVKEWRVTNTVEGFHQDTGSKAPLYMESGDQKFLRFDGSDDTMWADGFDLSGVTKATAMLALTQRSFGSQNLLEHGTTATSFDLALLIDNGNPSGNLGALTALPGTNIWANNSGANAAERTVVFTVVFDPAQAIQDDTMLLWIDGVSINPTAAASLGAIDVTAFIRQRLHLGSRNFGASDWTDSDIYAGLFIGRELTDAERIGMERTLSYRAGLIVAGVDAHTINPAVFSDTANTIDRTTHLETSPYARVDFVTDATSITVNSYNDYFGTFPAFTQLGVLVDGVWNQTISPGVAGAHSATISLPAGNKIVSIVNGLQSRPGFTAPSIGTFVTSITSNSIITQIFPPANYHTLFYGDSIQVGGNATDPPNEASIAIVRASSYPNSVQCEGWGSRSLHEDINTSGLRQDFVNRMMMYRPDRLWISIGTNDYALEKWSAADFGTAYAALLDDINIRMPFCHIYCQSPLIRSSESANSFGDTLPDYRAQIVTAVSTRTGFATYVDGRAILVVGNLEDGVHPSTAGHAIWATSIEGTLGI